MTALPKSVDHTYAVELDEDIATKLRGVADERGTSVETLIAAVASEYAVMGPQIYDDWSEEDIAAIEEGTAQLRRGEGIPHEEVMARLKAKYGG